MVQNNKNGSNLKVSVLGGIIASFILYLFWLFLHFLSPEVEFLVYESQRNVLVEFLFIGAVSGLCGIIGHLIGRILEQPISSSCNNYLGRSINDFFRISFWNFGIGTTYIYSFFNQEDYLFQPQMLVNVVIASIFPGIVCGLIFPGLNYIFHGDVRAPNQASSMRSSMYWFSVAGAIFGFVSVLSWCYFLNLKIENILKPVAFGTVTSLTYGLFLGFLTFQIGGLGFKDINKMNPSKINMVIGTIIALPITLLFGLILGVNSISLAFCSIIVAIYIGLLISSLLAFKKITSFVLDSLNDQFEVEGGIAYGISLLFMLITNIPWGICISIAIFTATHKDFLNKITYLLCKYAF